MKRITLVFDLPDDDVEQVITMIQSILDVFVDKVHLFKTRSPSKTIVSLFDNALSVLPADVIEAFHDKINCDLIPNWSKNTVEENMKTLIDLEIMADFLANNLVDEMMRD